MSEKPWLIVEGDRVQVGWANDQCVLRGVVRHIAMSDGDSWIIEADDGTPYYIQRFEALFRLEARKP